MVLPADGYYSPRSHHGFHEGTAWQYQWLAQQDVPGLVEAMDGREQAARRPMRSSRWTRCRPTRFNAARKAWVVGPYSYYNQFATTRTTSRTCTRRGCTPDRPAVEDRRRGAAAQQLFTNAPNGVTGNDDLGTMSAWYLFSAIGVYLAVPGSGQFPAHPALQQGGSGHGQWPHAAHRRAGADGRRLQYVQGVQVDGQPHAPVWLDWNQLQQARARSRSTRRRRSRAGARR